MVSYRADVRLAAGRDDVAGDGLDRAGPHGSAGDADGDPLPGSDESPADPDDPLGYGGVDPHDVEAPSSCKDLGPAAVPHGMRMDDPRDAAADAAGGNPHPGGRRSRARRGPSPHTGAEVTGDGAFPAPGPVPSHVPSLFHVPNPGRVHVTRRLEVPLRPAIAGLADSAGCCCCWDSGVAGEAFAPVRTPRRIEAVLMDEVGYSSGPAVPDDNSASAGGFPGPSYSCPRP